MEVFRPAIHGDCGPDGKGKAHQETSQHENYEGALLSLNPETSADTLWTWRVPG